MFEGELDGLELSLVDFDSPQEAVRAAVKSGSAWMLVGVVQVVSATEDIRISLDALEDQMNWKRRPKP
ncbi:MAG: hypothetical protein NWE79_00760 [Candidatus Bathyarchaeota archaeon]|nr:hypothetical protein [Candidatus Bathyarchaeota archaeon]